MNFHKENYKKTLIGILRQLLIIGGIFAMFYYMEVRNLIDAAKLFTVPVISFIVGMSLVYSHFVYFSAFRDFRKISKLIDGSVKDDLRKAGYQMVWYSEKKMQLSELCFENDKEFRVIPKKNGSVDLIPHNAGLAEISRILSENYIEHNVNDSLNFVRVADLKDFVSRFFAE